MLRENRDSVMAMLEAFVYDPMISWRVLAQAKQEEDKPAAGGGGAGAAREAGGGAGAPQSGPSGPAGSLPNGSASLGAGSTSADMNLLPLPLDDQLHEELAEQHREAGLELGAAGEGLDDMGRFDHILGEGPVPHDAEGAAMALAEMADQGLAHDEQFVLTEALALQRASMGPPPYVPSTMVDKRVRQPTNPEVHLAEAHENTRENINARCVEMLFWGPCLP